MKKLPKPVLGPKLWAVLTKSGLPIEKVNASQKEGQRVNIECMVHSNLQSQTNLLQQLSTI